MFDRYQLKMFESRTRNETPDQTSSKIMKDEYLTHVYKTIFDFSISRIPSTAELHPMVILEIGSAGGITKFLNQSVVTSDIRIGNNIDHVLQNEIIPFEDESIDRLIGKDVLHHIPDIKKHFLEVERCLKDGGVAVYAEPNWNLFSRFVFSFFHPEPFLMSAKEWKFASSDPMFSNQALPFVVFKRDLGKFHELFKNLKVEIYPPSIGVTFALSGGVYSRNKIPAKLLILLSKLENRSPVWMKFFGLNRFIVIRKLVR